MGSGEAQQKSGRKPKGGFVKGRFLAKTFGECALVLVFGARSIENHSCLLLGLHCRERLFGGKCGTWEHLPKKNLLETTLLRTPDKTSYSYPKNLLR